MSGATLRLELVAADRLVWSGEAVEVIARTTEGDIGILAHHAPTLSLLVEGVVEVVTDDGERLVAAIDGGILSIAHNRVSVLAETAELAEDIDLDQARRDLEEAEQSGGEEDRDDQRVRHLEARVRAAEKAS